MILHFVWFEIFLKVGTDHGVYASLDYGNNFFAFSNGLSNAPVHDLVLHPRERDLIVGTHGRSVYIANIKHLQMLSEKILSKNIYVFELEKIKFSSRWGSRGWGSNFYTPEIQIVYYSASGLVWAALIWCGMLWIVRFKSTTPDAGPL